MAKNSHDFKLRSNKGIRVSFQGDHSPQPLVYEYHLYDHSVADKWYENVVATKNQWGLEAQGEGHFMGAPLWPKTRLVKDLKRCFQIINEVGDTVLESNLDQDLSPQELNRLHAIYEDLAKLPKYTQRSPEVDRALVDLNLTIHRYEGLGVEGDVAYHVEVIFSPEQSCDIGPDEYSFFTPDRHFGNLYLTYGQVGVPPMAGFWSRTTESLNPQTTISAGFFLNFEPSHDFTQWEEMESWLRQSHQLDVDHPQLAIGNCPLGVLVGREHNHDAIFKDISSNMRITGVDVI